MVQGSLAQRFPVYQIDFSAVASGKRIASTKRRVRWRFGFTNTQALESGATGTECRGEEHDVTIVWSVTSGKRQVMCDGQEVHYSSNRSGVLDFSWPMRGSHMLKVVAHATPPLSATPGFRQYDMFIDGQSFFSLPKVYELGLKGPVPGHGHERVPGHFAHQPRALPPPVEQEDADMQRAIRASLEDSGGYTASRGYDDYQAQSYATSQAPAPVSEPVQAPPSDLLALEPAPAPTPALVAPASPPAYYGAPAPAPVNSAASVAPSVSTVGYYGAPTVAADTPTVYSAPPQTPAAYGSPYSPNPASVTSAPPPMQSADPLLQPVPPVDDPFAPRPPPPPTHSDIASSILGAYGTEPASTQVVPVTPEQGGQPYQTPQLENGPSTGGNVVTPVQQLSMTSMAIEEERKEEPLSDVDRALKNLVNFDDITEPAEQEIALTLKAKEEAMKGNPHKSKAIPPKSVFGAATLGDIKEKLPPAPAKNPEEIMKAPPQLFHPGAANAGALVVHGQGPPPLQKYQPGMVGQGFGVGAQMQQMQQMAQMQAAYGAAPQYQQPGAYPPQPPPQFGYANY